MMLLGLGSKGIVYNPRAQAYFDAPGTNITDATTKAAINDFFNGMDNYGVTSRCKVLFFNAGGSASANKYNAMDPRDADDAFRKTYYGSWTFASTGETPNGSNAYFDCHFNPSVQFAAGYGHFGYYSRTNNGSLLSTEIGCTDNVNFARLNIKRNTGGITSAEGSSNTTFSKTYSLSDSRGYSSTGVYNNVVNYFYRGSKLVPLSQIDQAKVWPDLPLFTGARNTLGTADQFSNKECAGQDFFYNLTEVEEGYIAILWQNFNTTLGRAV